MGDRFVSFEAKKPTSSTNQRQEGFHTKMSNQDHCRVLGIPVTSISFPDKPASIDTTDRRSVVNNLMGRLRKKIGRYMQGIRQIVRTEAKKSEIVRGNMSLSSRIMQAGGVDRVYDQVFNVDRGEKLLKTSKCYLSTTAGPIAGIVFISTKKVAFHSDKPIKLRSPQGQHLRVPYKVLIPQTKIRSVVSSQSTNKPSQKYIQIVTTDNFEFWFLGSSTSNKDSQECDVQ